MEQLKIAKWGNSLAVRLPSRMVKAMGLKVGDTLTREMLTNGAAIRARLDAERESQRLSREEGAARIRERWKKSPNLEPEDWKIDRNDPDMRG